MMSFRSLVRKILQDRPAGLTPQQIREIIKSDHKEFYGTETHQRNVEKGHYKDIDHALLAHIYVLSRDRKIEVDRSQKPIKLTLSDLQNDNLIDSEESIDNENLEKLEAGIGTIYVLGTNLYTQEGEEILKIGITTGDVEERVSQLYTTGVPFRARIIDTYKTKNFYEAEQAIHKLLSPYRLNRSREFFTEKCLPFVKQIVSIHENIQNMA